MTKDKSPNSTYAPAHEKPMRIVELPLDEIHPYENNPRRNESAVDVLAKAIEKLGYRNYILVDKDYTVISGHTRLEALKKLGWSKAFVVVADDMSPEQVKAHRLADNKIAELSGWDFSMLEIELGGITEFDMAEFGFDDAPIEISDDLYAPTDGDKEAKKKEIVCPFCGKAIPM